MIICKTLLELVKEEPGAFEQYAEHLFKKGFNGILNDMRLELAGLPVPPRRIHYTRWFRFLCTETITVYHSGQDIYSRVYNFEAGKYYDFASKEGILFLRSEAAQDAVKNFRFISRVYLP